MKPRKPIRKVSTKRAKLNREYTKLKAEFLKLHPYCQYFLRENELDEDRVFGNGGYASIWKWDGKRTQVPLAVDIHHVKGRGKYLLDTSTWMAVSREGHRHIHDYVADSYAMGYMQPRR